MDHGSCYRVNGSRVIHEVFENEVVIVNLDSGRYYCLQHAGAEIWSLVLGGRSVGDIARELAERYDAPATDIVDAVESVCRELLEQSLIVSADPAGAAAVEPAMAQGTGEAKRPFARPALQVYTDMQDLLLLDPIHEVDPAGWPVPRPANPEHQG